VEIELVGVGVKEVVRRLHNANLRVGEEAGGAD
jgi:hypothetical protein